MMRLLLLTILFTFLSFSASAAPSHLKLAFGSCHSTNRDTSIWSSIASEHPHVWIWGGDSIYADSVDVDIHENLYDKVQAIPEYADLVMQTTVLGIWDDHDFGANNAGEEYPSKEESKTAFLDFLGVPKSSRRRKRAGVYATRLFQAGDKEIRIVLLDTRYHREAPGEHADMLGVAQWRWLINILKKPADFLILVSGTQVIPEEHTFEKWKDYPESRELLLELLETSAADHILILSGDRHFAEFSVLKRGTRTINELTSSGMTHFWKGAETEENRHRKGAALAARNYALINFRVDAQNQKFTAEAYVKGNAGQTLARYPLLE